jgi:anti-sigma B factor antagonist
MALLLMLRHEGPIVVVAVRGPLTLSPTLRGFKKQIERFYNDGTKGLVLNLAQVAEMDSAGIGELVAVYTSAKRRGFEIALAGANKRIVDMLRLTRLDAFFTMCEDEAAAIRSLG